METALAGALAMVAAVAATALISRRTGLPSPVLLLAEGVVWALLPWTPNVAIDPQVVLVLILPPLLYSAALSSSLVGIRANARPIGLLAVGLVLATTLAVGAVGHLVIPGMSFAAACVLGAVVAPNDAIAAVAVGRTAPLPLRLQTVVEGEGLLNDATALTVYAVAVAAVTDGGFSLPGAFGRLLLSGGGGIALGIVGAYVLRAVKRRVDEPLVENCLSLATPFLVFLPAEELGVSGVVAVVVCGLRLGHDPSYQSTSGRLQTGAVWRLLTFVLEGVVFLLIGLDLAQILQRLGTYGDGELALWSAAVVATVIVVRPLWTFPATYLPRLSRRVRTADPRPGWQVTTALSWAGMRGVVTLAAAEGLPEVTHDGSPFPQRDLVLLLAFLVVSVTLLVQGLTFGALLSALGLGRDDQKVLSQQASAVQSAVRAGLSRLDSDTESATVHADVVARLRASAERRSDSAFERLGDSGDETSAAAFRRLRRAMIEAERDELIAQRDRGHLPDHALRELQVELDLEERSLDRG